MSPERAPLLPGFPTRPPPPPYPQEVPPYAQRAQRQWQTSTKSRESSLGVRHVIFVMMFVLLAAFFLYVMIALPGPALFPIERIEHDRLRQEWQKERQVHEHEIQKRNEVYRQWDREDHERRQKQIQRENEWRKHEQEMAEWREERARQFGVLWNEPQSAQHCLAYGVQEYTAQLNVAALSKISPVVIGGNEHNAYKVDTIQNGWSKGQILGHFSVVDPESDSLCRPYWGDVEDKGCVKFGFDSGTHRFEARIWGLRRGDDWETICATMPATINGIQFTGPTHCTDRGRGTDVGVFEYSDPACVVKY